MRCNNIVHNLPTISLSITNLYINNYIVNIEIKTKRCTPCNIPLMEWPPMLAIYKRHPYCHKALLSSLSTALVSSVYNASIRCSAQIKCDHPQQIPHAHACPCSPQWHLTVGQNYWKNYLERMLRKIAMKEVVWASKVGRAMTI